ncbi:MAG: peptide deformylase [Deltaproteobacteria bacterium]|nr:MAG: peptide deformylase [Deltaproteobacteria bacterium]
MAVLEVLKYPSPVLNNKALPVKEVDSKLKGLINDMAETMYALSAVGLAAPQVGKLLQVAVIDVTPKEEGKNLIVLINPRIVAKEGEIFLEEGCLSIPGYREKVKRWARVKVEAMDEHGEKREIEGEGLLSIALQHETDHLDGMLIIDRISSLKRNIFKKNMKKQLLAKEQG